MRYTKRANRGFTLLEILLVIAAIGILAAIVLVAINPNRQLAQARNSERRVELNSIYKAIEQYLIDKGSYPTGVTNTMQDICLTGAEQVGGATNCSGLVDLRVLVPIYLAGIPVDPSGASYTVGINADNNRISVASKSQELQQKIGINSFAANWTPILSSPSLWLDASDISTITLNSGNVSQWNDKSGSNKNATQSNSTYQPQLLNSAINGLSVINWGSSQNSKSIGYSSAGLVVKDVFIVGDFDGSAFNNYNTLFGPFDAVNPVGIVSLTNNYFYNYSDNTAYYFTNYYLNASSSDSNLNVFPSIASPFILMAQATRTDNNNWSSGYNVGADREYAVSLNRTWTGWIGEVLVFPSSLSVEDQAKVEGYLAHKWGLQSNLPSNHPYKIVPPKQQ